MNRSYVSRSFALLGIVVLISCNRTQLPTDSDATLTDAQKASLQKSGSNTVAPGVVGWWPGDGNANDIIGGNDGTLNGGTGFAPGQVDQAFSFDGIDDFVTVPGTFGGGPEASIDAWILTTGTNNDFQAIVHAPQGEFVHLQLFNSGNIVAYVDNTNFVSLPIVSQAPIGVFRHIALSIKSGVTKLYVDGTLVGSSNTAFSTINATSSLRIGASSSGGRRFMGLIEEVEIYNRALTQAEVQTIFQAGSKGNKPTKMVTICHKPGTPAKKTLVIPYHALAGHLGHGDTLGACN